MSQRSRHHFLVVENDPHHAELVSDAFDGIPDCGTVAIARNVSEAKAYLQGAGVYANRRRFPVPSTVLTDYRLDGEFGLELLSWAKKNPALSHIPFVLLAPKPVLARMGNAAKSLKATKVLKKPDGLSELKSTLEQLAKELCASSPPPAKP